MGLIVSRIIIISICKVARSSIIVANCTVIYLGDSAEPPLPVVKSNPKPNPPPSPNASSYRNGECM